MNNFEKECAKFERKKNNKLRKWWRHNGYKILRVVLFWLYIPVVCWEKFKDKRYKNLQYDDTTTKKYLDKVLPKLAVHEGMDPTHILIAHIYESDVQCIRFHLTFGRAWMWKRYKKASRYLTEFSQQVEAYIMNTYQIDGYKKMTFNNFDDWRAAKNMFEWDYVPWDCERANGVLFYKED